MAEKNTYTDPCRLDGRRALSIGSGGIGGEAARALAAHGAHGTCADGDGNAAHTVAAAAGGQSMALDITDPGAVRRAAAELGEIDVVVLTAAMNVRKRLLDYSPEEFDRVVELNIKGTFAVLKYFGETMVGQGRGSIIVFSSIRDQVVEPGQSAYAATKAGVVQLVKTAAAEFGPAHVRVNAISPGIVRTPLTAQIEADPDW